MTSLLTIAVVNDMIETDNNISQGQMLNAKCVAASGILINSVCLRSDAVIVIH